MKTLYMICIVFVVFIFISCQESTTSIESQNIVIPEWEPDAFLPPKEIKDEKPNFLTKDGIISVMDLEKSDKEEIIEIDNSIKYRTEKWAFEITSNEGQSWYVNKKERDVQISYDNRKKFEKEYEDINIRASKILQGLGLDEKEMKSTGVSTIVATATSKEETLEHVEGFIIQFQRQIEGVDVFSSRASVRFDPSLECLSWNVKWYENRANAKLIPTNTNDLKKAIETITSDVKEFIVTKQWMALPAKDNGTVLVPGYVIVKGTSRVAIPAIEIEGEITEILAMPEIPESRDVDDI